MLIGGSAKQQLEHERASWRQYSDERAQRAAAEELEEETEQKIIAHTELATKTKAIYVDGKLHYIPVAEAKRLELI